MSAQSGVSMGAGAGHVTCRRAYKTKGATARRFPLINGGVPDRRQALWRRQLLEAADGEDANMRLWAGVLKDAIDALRGRHAYARTHKRGDDANPRLIWIEACKWIMSRELEPLGTFESVCGVLELDTEAVRRDLCLIAAQSQARIFAVASPLKPVREAAQPEAACL